MIARVTFAAALAVALVADPAAAQTNNGSDVSGVNVTSSAVAGAPYSPGEIGARVPLAALLGISVASSVAKAELSAGITRSPVNGAAIAPSAQAAVASFLTTNDRDAGARVKKALDASGASPATVATLMHSLGGLLSSAGIVSAADAVDAFNALVRQASPGFLTAPPGEFQAIHAVLTELSASASSVAR